MAVTSEQIKQLSKEIPWKYKPQSVKYGKATMVSYVDARDVQDLFDEVLGPSNWKVEYSVINNQMFAYISIRVKHEDGTVEWVTKSDGGTESNMEQEKGLISDCFKRAAVVWSAGRFLYRQGVVELPTKDYKGKEKPATKDGRILWTNDEISEYIRSGMKNESKPASTKYGKPTSEPKYNKTSYTEETIKRVTGLEKNGKKGKECIKEHLESYNEANKTEIKKIQELDDESLNKVIDFIENLTPQGI